MIKTEILIPAFKIKTWILMVVLMAVLGLVLFLAFGAPVRSVNSAPVHAGTGWEYKVDEGLLMLPDASKYTERLNQFGMEGWEFVVQLGGMTIYKRQMGN